MKATTWLCPVLTLLCATKLVYTAQRGSYGGFSLGNMNSQMLQNDFFSKRNKPSLSIVNPLDVLRQRLLLEIARRQMKENSRQVELNRAILKNVGKRMASKYTAPLTAALYNVQHQQQEPAQNVQLYEYDLIPTTLIFDYLQQQQQQEQPRHPWLPYESNAIQFDNNYINDAIEESALASANTSGDDSETGVENVAQDIMAYNGVMGNDDKHSIKHIKQSNSEHSSISPNEQNETASFQKSINNSNDDTKRFISTNNHDARHHKNDLNFDFENFNSVSAKQANANDYKNKLNDNSAGDYQLQRYLYHLHKNQNHLTRK